MKKLFAVLAALFLLTIMACGSSGGGGEGVRVKGGRGVKGRG